MSTALKDDFALHAGKANEEHRLREDTFHAGQKSGNVESIIAHSAVATKDSYGRDDLDERNKKNYAEAMFLALLDQQLRNHREAMERYQQELVEKYGENFIDGMAAAYLINEKGLDKMDREAKLKALRDLMLDQNGEIKAQYADMAEAQYIFHWNKEQELEQALSNRIPGTPLTEAQKAAIDNADGTALTATLLTGDEVAMQAADNTVDNDVEALGGSFTAKF